MMRCKAVHLYFHLFIGFCLLLLSSFLALWLGAADISVPNIWLAFTSGVENEAITILREIRLPRIIGAIFVGAALALAGSIMQGVTGNPLADPGLFGITAGANLALAVTIAFISSDYFAIMIACFIGASFGSFLVLAISTLNKNGFSPLRVVLAGAAVSAFLYAIADGLGIYFNISKDVSMWSSGGLIGTNWSQLQLIIPAILICIIIALLLSRQLSLLSLNEETAANLGLDITFTKCMLYFLISMLTGAAVALAGNLVFAGLMIPHIVRAIIGYNYRNILPLSIFYGAIFMVAADLLGRVINAPFETPVSAIVAVMGLPFFLYIVKKGGKAF